MFKSVTVVLPCLNEEETIASCIKTAFKGLKKVGLKGEVLVVDNDSFDNSFKRAKKAGARVIKIKKRGYGSACFAGIKNAKGEVVVLGDSDATYNFLETEKLLKKLKRNYLVLGSRLKGRIRPGAMPFLHRFLGTPLLNLFLRLFYNVKVSDSQSGFRAFLKKDVEKLKLKSLGMEFASEMLVRAGQKGFKLAEVPVSYNVRKTPSKLSPLKDGWRHLRFLLLFAPTYLFLIPGGFLFLLGMMGMMFLSWQRVFLFGHGFDIHSLLASSFLTLLGFQIIMLGFYAKVYSWLEGFTPKGRVLTSLFKIFKLEKGILVGVFLCLIGFLVAFFYLIPWVKKGFGELQAIRPTIFAMTFIILGVQIIFSSFFLSILGMEKKDNLL
jgi:glycosyltransferase involved in cell wall biosynthesis